MLVAGPPVLWSRRHGKGRVLYRGDSALTQKVWRGAALQMILQSMPVSAAPIVNARVYFVDDCPQPMWNVRKYPVDGNLNMTDTDFYRKVWWPDMVKLANDFKQKLTFVLIFSYDARVREGSGFTAQPFYSGQSKGVPAWMAHEALRLGHEVGLHGYNHQSLVKKHLGDVSKGWQSRADRASSTASRGHVHRLLTRGALSPAEAYTPPALAREGLHEVPSRSAWTWLLTSVSSGLASPQ